MPLNKSKTPRIAALNEVGRYAIGVRWADGHDSIYPLESLRRGCPCKACGGAIAGEIPPASQRLSQLSRLGEQGVFLGWVDGHETLYTTVQLRANCRCAHCVAEPEKPITAVEEQAGPFTNGPYKNDQRPFTNGCPQIRCSEVGAARERPSRD